MDPHLYRGGRRGDGEKCSLFFLLLSLRSAFKPSTVPANPEAYAFEEFAHEMRDVLNLLEEGVIPPAFIMKGEGRGGVIEGGEEIFEEKVKV